uniref:Putative acetyltransferase n=1 Tax=viral metagenome TaxID=1070528 RepID=A0A6M3K7J7_9ZZZZ
MKLSHYIFEELSIDNSVIKSPKECTKEELDSFYKLVIKGGQVITGGLRRSINNAYLLAFYYDGDKLVSIRGVKRPNRGYVEYVFDNAGVPELANKYKYETGWAFTIPSHRRKGIGSFAYTKMLEKSKGVKIFATTREGNVAPQKILKKNGFKRLGEPYEGITEDNVLLWVRG